MPKFHSSAYVLVATTINKRVAWCEDRGFRSSANMLQVLAQDLATEFAVDNPRFDSDRFLTACGAK